MGCNCNGSSAAAAPAGGGGWQIKLRNGSFVGRFGTESAAKHALASTFNGAGTVVPR
jgi:hypothetical protein